jgi:predicted hydrocarbon binding protein
LLRALSGGGNVVVTKRPFAVTFSDCPLATLDEIGTACALYTGAIETTLRSYSGRDVRIVHTSCRAHGSRACEWREHELTAAGQDRPSAPAHPH